MKVGEVSKIIAELNKDGKFRISITNGKESIPIKISIKEFINQTQLIKYENTIKNYIANNFFSSDEEVKFTKEVISIINWIHLEVGSIDELKEVPLYIYKIRQYIANLSKLLENSIVSNYNFIPFKVIIDTGIIYAHNYFITLEELLKIKQEYYNKNTLTLFNFITKEIKDITEIGFASTASMEILEMTSLKGWHIMSNYTFDKLINSIRVKEENKDETKKKE